VQIRRVRPADLGTVIELAAEALGPEQAGPVVRAHVEDHHLLVADADGRVAGCLAYRTDWFQCTLVTLVAVRPEFRRRGVARALFQAVEACSPSPRLFSAAQETNAAAIRMHAALGFVPSGHIDNLPQGYRQLLFYKRLPFRAGEGP